MSKKYLTDSRFEELVEELCSIGSEISLWYNIDTNELKIVRNGERVGTEAWLFVSDESNWTDLAGGDSDNSKSIEDAINYYLTDGKTSAMITLSYAIGDAVELMNL